MAGRSITIRDFRTEMPGHLTEDGYTWEFPVVESINTHGKETHWIIRVRLFDAAAAVPEHGAPLDEFLPVEDAYFDRGQLDGIHAWIDVDSGLVEGKVRVNVPTIVSTGKNLQRANSTNVWTQALRDALGRWNKQMEKRADAGKAGASPGPAQVHIDMYPPMLAEDLADLTTPLVITPDAPVYVQRKYNGVRMIATLDAPRAPDDVPHNIAAAPVVLYSRTKKPYPGFPYLRGEIKALLGAPAARGRAIYLDGEVYKHGVPLQVISGHARREYPADSGDGAAAAPDAIAVYDYMVYDCFLPAAPDMTFSARQSVLDELFRAAGPAVQHVKRVETFRAGSMDEVQALYEQFLREQYEGAMVRLDDVYQYSVNSHRSRSLLKMKPVRDAEFEIIGFTSGRKGKAAGILMITCRLDTPRPDGTVATFDVTPKGKLTERARLLQQMNTIEANKHTHFENHFLGKRLVVYFDEYSKDGLPQRARTDLKIRTWD